MEKIALIAAGGAAGAVLRYLSVGWMGRLSGEIAFGTMFVNVAGSFLMGVLAVLMIDRMPGEVHRLAPLVMTGLLGGFTTFSAYSLDALRLFEDGRTAAALGYAGGSVLLSVGALALGLVLTRTVLG